MKRDALVIGINQYPFLKDTPKSKAKHLNTPASDAEAIAQLLETYGDFEVRRLPATNRDGKLRVDPKKLVKIEDLQQAIAELFQPSGRQVPETGLLFFAGHGLRRIQGDDPEGYLGTSDTNPRKDVWGFSLQWLRQLLQESPVRQQIIWLDCCHSGELFNFTESDLGEYEKGRDRCFIVASRDFQVAYAAVEGDRGVLSGALLQGLDPTARSEKWVTNYNLVDFVRQALKDAPQHPICTNSGGQILLTGEQSIISSICPYKGLAYFDFNEEDPKYFYGRTALTERLLAKVRSSNFLAVLGASGSGKSSVVRAGLLHQLKRGEAIPGSDRWQIYEPFTPGEHPLKRLEQVLGIKAEQIEAIVKAAPTERVVLTIDQFEEVFTECRGSQDKEKERQRFFQCLMNAVERLGNKLCLVLAMRSDFFGKCTEQEYSGLSQTIEQNLVTVLPMSQEELREAIVRPAEKVGLEIDRELVTEMIADVSGAPGDLPLMQYALTELWEQKTLNRLTISDYTRLGGVKKALEKQANEVYQSLSKKEQWVAKRIFLDLTRLGEETEDTRRQLLLEDLVNSQQSQEQVEQVVQHLTNAKLLVTSERELEGERLAVVNIAHEALIRNWGLLGHWLQDNRDALLIKQDIEDAAKEWRDKGKPKDSAYLLQGQRLVEAENFSEEDTEKLLLSNVASQFIQQSIEKRRRDRLRLISTIIGVTISLGVLGILALISQRNAEISKVKAFQESSETDLQSEQELEALIDSLRAGKKLQGRLLQLFKPNEQLVNQVRGTLQKAVYQVKERNRLENHQDEVQSVIFSPDGNSIATSEFDGTIRLWSRSGELLKKFNIGQFYDISFNPDSTHLVTVGNNGDLRIWDFDGNQKGELSLPENELWEVMLSTNDRLLVVANLDRSLWDLDNKLRLLKFTPLAQFVPLARTELGITAINFSPDGRLVATVESDGDVGLWTAEGKQLAKLKEHQSWPVSVSFSPDGKLIATAGYKDDFICLWDLKGNQLAKFRGYQGGITDAHFSPDSTQLATAGRNGTVRLWEELTGKHLAEFSDYPERDRVTSVSFSFDSDLLATGGGNGIVRVWDWKNQQKLAELPKLPDSDWIWGLSFSRNSRLLASSEDDGTIRLWDWKNQQQQLQFQGLGGQSARTSASGLNPEPLWGFAFSSDNSLLATGNAIYLWNRENQKQLIELHKYSPDGWINRVAFNPKKSLMAAGSTDGEISLWDWKQKRQINKFRGHQNEILSISFSSDGQRIATAGRDGTVGMARMWDLSGKLLGEFRGHPSGVNQVIFSPNESLVATAGRDGTVRLWNLSGQQLAEFRGHQSRVASIAFSSDGKQLASAGSDGIAKLWRIEELDELLVRGCDWVRNYLTHNADRMEEEDSHLCKDIQSPGK